MANTTETKILTTAGRNFLAQVNAEESPFKVDKLIFANIPDRADFPQPEDGVPTDYVVYEKAVERRGRLGPNVVIYSTTLTSAEGPFEFNWTGAYNAEHDVLLAIDHHSLTPKNENRPGIAGNTLVRSMSLEYKDIAEITNIQVDASTWQYDSTQRLAKMDNDAAQAIIDQNGKDWFIDDGFLVTPQSGSFKIQAGAGYVSGNRVSMEYNSSIQVLEKPAYIYMDAWREGTPTGQWETKYNFVVSADELDDYQDTATTPATPHFVCKIAQVMGDGSVQDLRPDDSAKTLINRTEKKLLTKPSFPFNGNDLKIGDQVPAGVSLLSIDDQINHLFPIPDKDRKVIGFSGDGKLIFDDGSVACHTPIQNSDTVIFNANNTREKDVSFTDILTSAMIEHTEVTIDGVEIWVSESFIPVSAKLNKLIIKNGGVLRFDDKHFVIECEGKSIVIDQREGGKIHGGLRKCLVARDHAPGETVIDVVDASELREGDHLATSMMGNDGEGNKWTNAPRSEGDEFNTILAIDGNKVTVQNPVGSRCLVKNTWLGNAEFGKGGLYFKGNSKSFVVSILGGEMIETGAGYYFTVTTDIGEEVDPAYVFVRGTKFKGQFLDGFLLRGEEIHTSFDDDWDIHKAYDIAKQSFVQDTGGDIELRNGKLRRGNFDVEFYPTGRKVDIGAIRMLNVQCDGKSTLLVQPDQINTITGKPLSETWQNLGDSLHVTQWKLPEKRLKVKGFYAEKCSFKNYRRAVVGTTFEGAPHDLTVDGDILMNDCDMDCQPHHIVLNGDTTLYMSGDWQYKNLTINILYSDPYYLLGYCFSNQQIAPEPVYSGVTTLKTTSESQYPNSCNVGTMQTLHCIGKGDGTAAKVRLVGPYNIERIIAENVEVFKLNSGQDNYLTQTVTKGNFGVFTGQRWRNEVVPSWITTSDSLNTDSSYTGSIQKKSYLNPNELQNWVSICKVQSANTALATCELSIKPCKAYGGSGYISANFFLALSPDNSEVIAEVLDGFNGVINVGHGLQKAYGLGSILVSNFEITDISSFVFRLTNDGVLQMKIIADQTPDVGMLFTAKGNVVGKA